MYNNGDEEGICNALCKSLCCQTFRLNIFVRKHVQKNEAPTVSFLNPPWVEIISIARLASQDEESAEL